MKTVPTTAKAKTRAAAPATLAPSKPRAIISFLDAMESSALFGREWFAPRESWATWRVLAKALFAEPMTGEEKEVYRRHTGRLTPPTEPTGEAWLVIGRRGGKSFFSAAIAVYVACLRPPAIKHSERGRVIILAADRSQAGEVFHFIEKLLESIPVLNQMVVARTKESIDVVNDGHDIRITVETASYRTIRGRKVLLAICDEISIWHTDEKSVNPDHEILTAIRPSMMGAPGALLLCISSPFARRGALWEAYRDHYGKDQDNVLVWRASTLAMYPGADPMHLEQQFRRDPVAYRAEYEAEFRTDLEAYISIEVLGAVTVKGQRSLPYEPETPHYAFMDPAGGGGGDSMTLAVARREGNKSVICRIAEWRPPFDAVEAGKEAAAILREYRLSRVHGDRFSGGTWRSIVKANGISYEFEERTKSDLFHDFLPLLTGRRVTLLDHPRTNNQFLLLERTTSRLGKDTISHPSKAWDDLANAVAGAALLAQRPKMLEHTPAPAPAATPQPGSGTVETIVLERWRCELGHDHPGPREKICPQTSMFWASFRRFGPSGGSGMR